MKLPILATLILMLNASAGFSQDNGAKNDTAVNAEKIFEKVEIEAAFPGGRTGWIEFLQKNLKPNIPVKKKAPAGTYQVVVRFIISKDGNISDITPETSYGYGMEEEVVRVIRKSPKWIPASQAGRKVNAYRRQPITFQVAEK
ncbi:MAG: energy transducer TonB [Ferruginibacter sp.]